MKIFLRDLPSLHIEKLIFNSLEQMLYQVIVVIDGEEFVVWRNEDKTLLSNSLLQLREQMEVFDVEERVLRHESTYDEMIGMPVNTKGNRLEVPLGKNPYTAIN